MRLHRLLGIIMLLDSRGIVKANNLARILEASERTIYRDIDILCEAGIPIMSIPGPNGGYSFMDSYKINANTLESGDALQLLLSSMGIIPEKNTETAQQLKNALIKLESSVSAEHREEIIKAREKFFIDSEPWWGKKTENRFVDIIKKSVLNLRKLKIHYKKYTGEVSERIINPYGIVVKSAEWYVVGFCEIKKDIRIFKCNRIASIEVLDESFNMPHHFSLEEFWGKSIQQFSKQSSQNIKHNNYPVRIKFYVTKDQLLNGFFIKSSYKIKDHWVYDIDMISFETACSVIFPLSDRIEVLEPVELREYIIKKTDEILKIYN